MLEDYSLQRFQATPQTLLTPAQSQDLLMLLFSSRAERNSETPLADSELRPQPIWAPFIEILPRPLAQRPALTLVLGLALFFFLLWLLLVVKPSHSAAALRRRCSGGPLTRRRAPRHRVAVALPEIQPANQLFNLKPQLSQL